MNRIGKLLLLLILVSILGTTIAYSSLSVTLDIKGKANVRAPATIRVTEIKLLDSNDAQELYNPSYTKNSTAVGFKLNNSNSYVTYAVTIKNSSDIPMEISKITESVNNNIKYEITNYNLYDLLEPNASKTINIKYSGIGTKETVLNFAFSNYYNTVSFNALNGKFNNESSINKVLFHYNGKINTIIDGTIYKPILNNSIFKDWYLNDTTIFNLSNPKKNDIEVFAKYEELSFIIDESNTINHSRITDSYTLNDLITNKHLGLNKTKNTINSITLNFDYTSDFDEEITVKLICNNTTYSKDLVLSKEDVNKTLLLDNINIPKDYLFTIIIDKKKVNNLNTKITNFSLIK